MDNNFVQGQLVAYCPIDSQGNIYKVEIGRFNKYNKNKTGAFVWYHMGGMSACTPLQFLHPIANDNYLVIGHTFNSLDKEEEQ
ncbi:hypothetical protein [Longibaculum muris]|uniref:hypothetical protein n=1 Tax=Longibaculum muris TaxID=1796628 RepID=UPI0022E8CECB|nr:hypothetical protein [Longibaculum muris]